MPQTSPSQYRFAPDAPIRVRTFGATLLERQADDGTWVVLQRTGKVLGVLIYLAAQDGRRVPRERLADLLWGDEAPERARATLRQTLYALRGMIGEAALDSDREEVGIAADRISVDRDLFLDAARLGKFDDMLALYTGPFCARLDVGGAHAYERWVISERNRLRTLMLDEGERAISALLTDGRSQDAVSAARQLAAAEPEEFRVAVLLFDALVAAGMIAEARERLDAVRAAVMHEDDSIPEAVAERLARLRRVSAPRPMPAAGTLAVLGQRLVGRDATLDALLREAERAREGRPRRVVLVGPAGSGKSRVLDEFDARMRLRGARVVRVRLHPGMRDVPYSAFSDTVRALSQLPAALGVSERSARVLVGLLPELATRYPAARGASLPEENKDFALRDAAADLFASVAEQRLVAHLVDDLHYADDASRALFKAVRLETERRKDETLRLITVRSLRRISAFDLSMTDAVVDVSPLTRDDVRAMLVDVAALPTLPWGEALVEQLWSSSHGTPQAVLQAVRAASAQGVLGIVDGVWDSHNPDALLRNVAEFAGPGPLLDALDPAAARVLTLLAAWGRVVDERDVAGLCACDVPAIPTEQWRPALAALEELGLVQSREATWGVAHDSVLEVVLRDLAKASPQDPFDTLLTYWGAHQRVTVGVLEHLSLLAGQREEPSRAIRLARQVLRAPALEQAGISAGALARRIAQGSGHLEWEPMIFGRLGLVARQSDRTRALLTGGIPMLVATLVWFIAMLQPRLVVQADPMAVENAASRQFEFAVQPRVAMMDGFGRIVAADAEIRVRSDQGLLVGDTVVALDSGRAQFRRLVLQGNPASAQPDLAELVFEGPWYARDVRTRVRGAHFGESRDAFRMVSLAANGREVRNLEVRASTLDTLSFDLTFEYTTAMPTARYVVGALPTWVGRDSAAMQLTMLARPVEKAWRTVRFTVPPAREPGVACFVVLLAEEEQVVDELRNEGLGARCEELRATGRLPSGGGRGMLPGMAVRVEFVAGR